jgi:uncharacterized integral membrane protein (TIGR00698 family)
VLRTVPGLAVSAAAVAVAFLVNRLLPALSPLTIAVILGALVGNLGLNLTVLKPGLRFAAKRLLRAGIVLLGLKLAVGDVLQVGGRGLAVVVAVVAITFFGTQLLGRVMGVPAGARLLIATGFSICGASAVAAMDSVTRAKEEDVVTAIALVTMCGSLAIVLLPLLQQPLGLSDAAFGTWVGASVHDVAQVVATASVVGPAALTPAVIVKLPRVVLLAPLVAGMSLWRRRRNVASYAVEGDTADGGAGDGADRAGRKPPIVPLFVAGFLAMVAVRSLNLLPAGALNAAQTAETILLAAALFGLGTSVHLKTLFTTGGRALALGLSSWVMIAGVAYGGVLLVGA